MRHADSLLVRTRIPKDQFGRYLRTGSWLRPDDHVEVKFNPWHDPKTGRFTFKGGGNGTWSGGGFTGGGGGSTGGGGASGNWGPPGKTQADQSRSQRVTITGKPGASAIRTVAASAVSSPTGTTVARNGYTYKIDDEGRTTQVTGTLTLNPNQTRSRAAQAAAGGADRLPTDDGGHYVAVRFDGPTDTFNHFAQDANFYRGGYRMLENQWAKDVRQGDPVWVKIVPEYAGSSQRPGSIDVFYSVDGHSNRKTFSNSSSKGKLHGG